MDDVIVRLERIHKRMHAVGTAPPETVAGYRTLLEIVYAELDSIIADLRAQDPPSRAK